MSHVRSVRPQLQHELPFYVCVFAQSDIRVCHDVQVLQADQLTELQCLRGSERPPLCEVQLCELMYSEECRVGSPYAKRTCALEHLTCLLMSDQRLKTRMHFFYLLQDVVWYFVASFERDTRGEVPVLGCPCVDLS